MSEQTQTESAVAIALTDDELAEVVGGDGTIKGDIIINPTRN